jgi:hypothetical protein
MKKNITSHMQMCDVDHQNVIKLNHMFGLAAES